MAKRHLVIAGNRERERKEADRSHQAVESEVIAGLLEERGPMSAWEIAAALDITLDVAENKVKSLLENGTVEIVRSELRDYYALSGYKEDNGGVGNFFKSFMGFLNRNKDYFKPLQKRIAIKEALLEEKENNLKKLIQEVYYLSIKRMGLTEEERINFNNVVEKEWKKLKTLYDKRVYLTDIVYEKAPGNKEKYFRRRKLIRK